MMDGYTDAISLTIEQDPAYEGYQYVEFQVQPEVEAHLRYSLGKLDWPPDEKGNMQERGVDEQDDVRLIPVLLLTSNVDPGDELASDYRLAVWPSESDADLFDIMIPLTPVGAGGAIRAFSGKLVFGTLPDTVVSLNLTGARMVWLVRGTTETPQVSTTVIARYQDRYRLTGLQLAKSSNYEFAIFYTPASPRENNQLFKLRTLVLDPCS